MKLAIVIIEYQSMTDVFDCIASVRKYLSGSNPKLVVISNSSYPTKVLDNYRFKLGEVTLVDSGKNLGYAGGVNLGLEITTDCDFVYILNPDCLLTDSNVSIMLKTLKGYPKWALAGPKVINKAGEVQPSSRRFPKFWTYIATRSFLSKYSFFAKERARYFMKDYSRQEITRVDWISGGAMLVNTSLLDNIGKMDANYFLYMEDVDWCRTVWDKGYSVMYCPESIVMHAGKHSSIKFNFRGLLSPHIRWHIASIIKYFKKWGYR